MRYDANHKQKSRERVIAEAAKAIRSEGPQGISVAGVMGAAGLTHGAFYAHFDSRDALLRAGIDRMFEESRARIQTETGKGVSPKAALTGYIAFYLSRSHRDSRTTGCPLPFLAAEAPRLNEGLRERYAQGVRTLTDTIAGLLRGMGHPEAETTAASVLAEMVGAVSLARAEPDPDRSYAILSASRASLRTRLGLENLQ
ncbi:MAG TPA: TetR/AcrR family transcriptional regulator [Phenylobacterium sp.]|jgi:TetR/AcrR family transcriptional repressor of nem operon